jgi:hypothetical protein
LSLEASGPGAAAGLHAFGRGKRVICMDGYDLDEALARELPLNHVLERKVRRAAETRDSPMRVRLAGDFLRLRDTSTTNGEQITAGTGLNTGVKIL